MKSEWRIPRSFHKHCFSLALAFALLVAPAWAQDEAPAQVLFTNVNVFDGVNDGLAEGMSVLIEGNLITAVSAEAISAEGAAVIDGGGRTLDAGD